MDLSLFSSITTGDIVFVVAGFAGMVLHYVKKKAKAETLASMAGYFIHNNLAATLSALGVFGMAVIGALGSGVITPDMNLWAILYAGLTTGFSIDSGFNSESEKPVVSEKPTE